MLVQEFVDDIGSEGERYTSVVFRPARNVLFRIGPKQVAEQSGVRDVRRSVDSPDLLHVLKVGREAAVAAEDLVVDDGGDGETVEAIWVNLEKNFFLEKAPVNVFQTFIENRLLHSS